MISDDVNRFFNDCALQIKINKKYLQQFVELTNKDIQNIKIVQPNINMAEITKVLATLAEPQKIEHTRNKKTITTNKYQKKFDNVLTSLWFCFYRFLFVKKLNTIVESLQIQIVFDTFFKFMRYVNLDTIKDGPQITAFFNVVLYSVTAMHISNYTKHPDFIAYDDLIQQLDKSGNYDVMPDIDENNQFHQYISIKYIVDYLMDIIPDYEFIQELNAVAYKGKKEFSEYALNKINEYCEQNNISKKQLINLAISAHQEYIIAPLFDELMN